MCLQTLRVFLQQFPSPKKTIALSSPSKPLFSPFVALSLSIKHCLEHCSAVPCVFIIIIKVHLMQEVSVCLLFTLHARNGCFSFFSSFHLSSYSITLPSISKPFFSGSHVASHVLDFRVRSVFFITHDVRIYPGVGLSVFALWIFVHEMLVRLSHDDHPVCGFLCS